MGKLLKAVDYNRMRLLLKAAFEQAESLYQAKSCGSTPGNLGESLDILFASKTQAHREVLVGCLLVSLHDQSRNIAKPYLNQGDDAYSGRGVDENVVNRLLKRERIPSSGGPFLSVYRRSVEFTSAYRSGISDKDAFDALLRVLAHTLHENDAGRKQLLIAVLCRFLELREASEIPLLRLNRISARQYTRLLQKLLGSASGGRYPVLICVAAFKAVASHFSLDWQVVAQGINQADATNGAGGDVVISSDGVVLLVVEVTERVVSKERVITTFQEKIAPTGIRDYIFFAQGTLEAEAQAQQYFAQGSEVNFVDLLTWVSMTLVTMGVKGRTTLNEQLTSSLDGPEMPKSMKLLWNSAVTEITTT